MFDVSFGEMVIVGVVALIVVGPQKIPEVARTAGRWVGKFKRMSASFRADLDRELHTEELRKMLTEQQEEVKDLRQMLDENRTAIEKDLASATAMVNQAPGTTPSLTQPVAAPASGGTPATPVAPPSVAQHSLDAPHGGSQ